MPLPTSQTELFSFISLRPPQLIDPVHRDYFFVEHPDPSASHFLREAADAPPKEARRQAEKGLRNYNPLGGLAVLKKRFAELYRFAVWLGRVRLKAEPQALRERTIKVSALAERERLALWDELIFRHLKGEGRVRQLCIQLLSADHFVRLAPKARDNSFLQDLYDEGSKMPDEDKLRRRTLRRLAAAKVVLPRGLGAPLDFNQKPRQGTGSGPDRDEPNNLPPLDEDAVRYLREADGGARAQRRYGLLAEAKKAMRAALRGPAVRRRPLKDLLAGGELQLSSATQRLLARLAAGGSSAADVYRDVNRDLAAANRAQRDAKATLAGRKRGTVPAAAYLVTYQPDAEEPLFITVNGERKGIRPGPVDLTVTPEAGQDLRLNRAEGRGDEKDLPTFHLPTPDNAILNGPVRLRGRIELTDGRTIDLDENFGRKGGSASGIAGAPAGATEKDDKPDLTEGAGEPGKLYGVNHLGLGIFRRVVQEVCCYVPGEVSHIENVMAREYKDRSTRQFSGTETATELELSSQRESLTDTATTVRNELQSAVAEVLSKSTGMDLGAGVGVSGSYGATEFSANGSFGYATANASSASDAEALTFARETTDRATSRLLSTSKHSTSVRAREEYEENTRHGYDNREGEQHVSSVYRWIDIVYDHQLINYGNMEMVEFTVPEPARLYKDAILGKLGRKKPPAESDGGPGNDSDQPKTTTLADLGIFSPEDLAAYPSELSTGDGTLPAGRLYSDVARELGTYLAAPPAETKNATPVIISAANLNHNDSFNRSKTGPLPEDYEVFSVELDGYFEHNPGTNTKPFFNIDVAGENLRIDINKTNTGTKVFTKTFTRALTVGNPSTGPAAISANGVRVVAFSVNVNMDCRISPEALLDWKTEAYQALLDVEAGDALDDLLDPGPAEEVTEEEDPPSFAGGSSAMNRRIEIRELKRLAIEILTRPHEEYIGKRLFSRGKCRVPYPHTDREMAEYAERVKFFEQAFEWEIMAYHFYPYYWADRCDWQDLLTAEDTADHIFEAFLQSGMARLIVPIRRGFEEVVNRYLQDGVIWNGEGLVYDTDDELYLSIHEELAEPEGEIEETWQTRLPTRLTILQEGSTGLATDKGLPCCATTTGDGTTTGIDKNGALLGVLTENQ